MAGGFRIEVLEKDFPYEDITELLHESYREHAEAGRNYLAARQTVEDTKRRLEGHICAVAYDGNGKLVGTISGKKVVKAPGEKKKWYEDDKYIYIAQMAVHPDYRNTLLLSLMSLKFASIDWIKECGSWVSDTSTKAKELTDAYVKMGFQIVDLVSWQTTNYYSYVFRKPNKGRVFSDRYVKFRFALSSIRCRLLYREDGKPRWKGSRK
jgi:hypothetical protein